MIKRAIWRCPGSLLAAVLLVACSPGGADLTESGATPQTNSEPTPSAEAALLTLTKWDLWASGETLLRGINVYQRRIYPELDGREWMGPGPYGPPYDQQEFDDIAAMGANYVNISHAGLYTESAPYLPDPAAEANLDRIIDLARNADLFVVISIRTGPGRSEFSFLGEPGDWFDESYVNNSVWETPEAQQGWVEMWRHIAQRYRNTVNVVGYDLMVEPNASAVIFDNYDPESFYAAYEGSSYDWNQFYPRIAAAIREVDLQTPILVGGMSWSSVEWLPYLQPTDEAAGLIYTAHQYSPHDYTHQEPGLLGSLPLAYPGEMDLNWDGEPDAFDRAWIEGLMETVEDFSALHGVPVAINEYGVKRFEPGAAQYLHDMTGVLESLGVNYAIWAWAPTWQLAYEKEQAFEYRLGPDLSNRTDVYANELTDVLTAYWSRNTLRPSKLHLEGG